MVAELKETLELVRVCHQIVTFNRHHAPSPPVRAACDRVDKALIGCLQIAFDELAKLWPAMDPKETARFIESLEHGVIPEPEGLEGYLPYLLNDELSKFEKAVANQRDRGAKKVAA